MSQLTDDDTFLILNDQIERKTLVNHHINSFNSFISTGINQIVTQLFSVEKSIQNERNNTPEDKNITYINIKINFTNVSISRPTTSSYLSGMITALMPNQARQLNRNYSASISIDADITAKAFRKTGDPIVRTATINNYRIASLPIMVGSQLCHTSSMSSDSKKRIQEDPLDPGGYFILRGKEWIVSMIETRLFNHPHIFRNIGYEKEITRLEFISKPGDAYENSSEMIIRYLNNGNIYLTFTSHEYFKNLQIPFYILFRIFGMETDKEIIDNIVYSYQKDVITDHMLYVLKKAFRAPDPLQAQNIIKKSTLIEILSQQISAGIKKEVDSNMIRYLNYNILKLLDKFVFPHLGLADDSRHKKMRYLGHLIHEMLLVEMQIVPSTDRDSLKNKRINAAGRSCAKAFKTQFNLTIVQSLKKRFTQEFKRTEFSKVSLETVFKNSIRGPELEKSLVQVIISGSHESSIKTKHPTRLASELLNRKNQLNMIASLRVIRTPSSTNTQDERADEMRRVHPSFIGYIDPIQSADTGEPVGLIKQMALGSRITEASTSELLKQVLLADPDVIPLERIFPNHIRDFDLAKILVNGDWIGCCPNSFEIWRKYREYRRGYKLQNGKFIHAESLIHRKTTIYWDTNTDKLEFWVDAGRMIRPLLVVRNNGELDPIGQEYFGSTYDSRDPNSIFIQNVIYTKQHAKDLLAGKITSSYLHKQGIIDYISPEEQENCFIASSISELEKEKNNPLRQFTHCEIPISILGLPVATCPYANHNQSPRLTFQSNQVKQTCGMYTLSYPFRIDKHNFLQWECQMPLIRTVVNKYIYPNGMNFIVAISYQGGYNQEDSLIFNRHSAQLGLCKGTHFNFIKAELENGEFFATPTPDTVDLIPYSNYSNLKDNALIDITTGLTANGICLPRTKIKKDDIIIGKIAEVQKGKYKDASIPYTYIEPAIIDYTIIGRDHEGNEFRRTKVSSTREVSMGDKFCLTPEFEVCCARGWIPISEVTTSDLVLTSPEHIHWEKPTNIYKYDIDENIYELNSKHVKLRTTLNHRMYVSLDSFTFEPIEAEKIINMPVYYLCTSIPNTKKTTFVISGWEENKSHIFIDEDVFCFHINYSDEDRILAIIALYLCLGKIKNNKIMFKKKKRKLITSLTKKSSIWLRDFIKSQCIDKSGRKRIPKFIYNLSSSHICSFLSLMVYASTGVKFVIIHDAAIIDKIQLLSHYAGLVCGIFHTPNYSVAKLYAEVEKARPGINLNKIDDKIIKYTGPVYCLHVPSEIFLVRNNKGFRFSVWTCNSSRHGQKGVISMIYDHMDMPFTSSGIVPNLILSPHAIPSRMTVGQIIEGIACKLAALTGTHGDATIFRPFDGDSIGDALEQYGFDRRGTERMYCGLNGEWIDTEIFITPIYYQRLQKFAIDDIYAISTGPTAILTRQYLKGKGNHGGLRIGEMEVDVLIAHGVSHFIMEKFRDNSDGFDIYVCRNCRKYPVVNETKKIMFCNTCQSMGLDPDIVKIRSTWGAKLFFQELESCNVGVKMHVTPFEYEVYS